LEFRHSVPGWSKQRLLRDLWCDIANDQQARHFERKRMIMNGWAWGKYSNFPGETFPVPRARGHIA